MAQDIPPKRATPPSSLLIPPNPSFSPEQPKGSILLNRHECNRAVTAPLERPGLLGTIKDAFVWKETGPPRAALQRTISNSSRPRGNSISAETPSSARRSPSPSIRFAPLPETGVRRTRSITLGVAARGNMLKTQGSAAPTTGKNGAGHYVMMTDEEWEEYQRKMGAHSQPPPDLHLLVAAGTKKLWKKARSLSSSSSTSTTSQPPPTPSSSKLASESSDVPRGRSGASTLSGEIRTHAETSSRARLRNLDSVVPESAIADDGESDVEMQRTARSDSTTSTDFGSITEEEEEDQDMDRDRDADGDVSMDNDAGEIDDTPIPEYLKSDMKAERSHFDHEFQAHHSYERQSAPLDHENLTRHLRNLEIGENSMGRRDRMDDGEETPRGARTPSYRMGMEGFSMSHAQAQG